MLRVGLTGAAGAGKSTVARELARMGIPVVDADKVAHELYAPGSAVVAALAAAFGDGVLTPDGAIDRAALGALVFGSAERLCELDRIVHPPLLAELERRLLALERAGEPVAVLEAALLLKWGPPDFVDLVVGVTASRELRRGRLLDGGLTAEAAERRLDLQVSPAELERRSDLLVQNERGLGELKRAVAALAEELRRRASRTE
jgi:dephospho-CoA kinase